MPGSHHIFREAVVSASMIDDAIKDSVASEVTVSWLILRAMIVLVIINLTLDGVRVTMYQLSGFSCSEIQFLQGDEH
jgi:hypothetical protein